MMDFCHNCGNKVESTMKFCPKCGTSLIVEKQEPPISPSAQVQSGTDTPKEVRAPTMIIGQAESTFYSDSRGVRVTTTRLIITKDKNSATYAMANISSVKTDVKPANRVSGVIFAIIGVLVSAVSYNMRASIGIIFGVILFILGVILACVVKPMYILKIT